MNAQNHVSELADILNDRLSALNDDSIVGLGMVDENAARAVAKKAAATLSDNLPKLLSFYKEHASGLDELIGSYMCERMKHIIADEGEEALANLFMDGKKFRKEIYEFILSGEKIAREGGYTIKAVQDALDKYLMDF
jgi:hypothetical protein